MQLAFVHHTVTANDYGPEDSAAIVLGITRYHRDTNGWNDVGYNFLVDQYGQVFEGRAGGVDQAIVGAQAQGWNSVSTGIACLGTFTASRRREAGLDALAQLIGWKLDASTACRSQGQVTATSPAARPTATASGTPVVFERISGHRDGNATSCPGELLYAQLPDLRSTRRAATPRRRGARPVHARVDATRCAASRRVLLSGGAAVRDGAPAAGAPVDVLFAAPGGRLAAHRRRGRAPADGAWSAPVTLTQGGTRVRAASRATRCARRPTRRRTDMTILPRLPLRAVARAACGAARRVRGAAARSRRPALRRAELDAVERRERRPLAARAAPAASPCVDGRFGTAVRPARAGRATASRSPCPGADGPRARVRATRGLRAACAGCAASGRPPQPLRTILHRSAAPVTRSPALSIPAPASLRKPRKRSV